MKKDLIQEAIQSGESRRVYVDRLNGTVSYLRANGRILRIVIGPDGQRLSEHVACRLEKNKIVLSGAAKTAAISKARAAVRDGQPVAKVVAQSPYFIQYGEILSTTAS